MPSSKYLAANFSPFLSLDLLKQRFLPQVLADLFLKSKARLTPVQLCTRTQRLPRLSPSPTNHNLCPNRCCGVCCRSDASCAYVRVSACACGRRKEAEQIISLIMNTGNKGGKPTCHARARAPNARTHTHPHITPDGGALHHPPARA